MQTTDINIKYINKVSDNLSNPCVVVFTDITNSSGALAVAWQVIKNIDRDDWYTFNYTLATSIQVTWNNSKSGTTIVEVKNSSLSFGDTGNGFSFVENGSLATANQFEVINKASIPGGISVTAFKDQNPIAVKHTVAKDQKAKFIFHPKLYWAVVDDIDVGDIVYLEDIPTYTEISLEELETLTVTLKGSLQNGYTFTASEKVPASDSKPIRPSEPCQPSNSPGEPLDSSESGNTVVAIPETVFVESKDHQDLFPFVYMHTWHDISQYDLQRRFVKYDGKNAPPESLYSKLVEIKKASQPDARFQMEKEVISFIEGTQFTGEFIPSLSELQGSIKYFAVLNCWLRQQPSINLPQLKVKIVDVLKLDWTNLKQYIQSPEYLQEKDKVWQNFFAMTISLDYHPHLLEDVTKALVMCNLLERIIVVDEDSNGSSETENKVEIPDTSQDLIEAAKATIILPKDIFPLPPASEGDSQSNSKATEWIEPYAIGDLQIVRQSLLRYELGEVAHIENVLKGERKETTQRKFNQVNESVTNTSEQLEDTESDIYGTRADLLNETRKTLAKEKITTNFNDFNTSYGPPTMVTYKGSWSVEKEPDQQKPYIENVTKFAKDITIRTANRISRYVNQMRTFSTLTEAEETVTHAFDNRNSTSNVIGIYRWVNKIYSAHVVNYGHRLMLEFMIQNPAKTYIKSWLQLQGNSLYYPIAPDQLNPGITSYKAITPENYADLVTRYELKDIQPPPTEVKIIPVAFKNGEPINIKKLSVPEGYRAKLAWVTGVLTGNTQLTGFIGKKTFTLTATSSQIDSLEMNNEDVAIAACVMCSTEPTSPPLSEPKYGVTIEVQCHLAPEKLKQWQIKTYNAILARYRQQQADYYEGAGIRHTKIGSHNPLENRKIEKIELKKDCTKQLLRQQFNWVGYSDKASEDKEPSQFSVNAPRYIQFFEQAFEWDEMTYQFYPHLADPKNQEQITATPLNYYSVTDSLFTNFLQAESVRVLLPVRPDYALLVLYYLSSGTIWSGVDALTPTHEKNVSLVNELKILSEVEHECKYVSQPWEITIPTAMMMLQDESKLPQFQPKVCRST